MRATGMFEVKLAPMAMENVDADAMLGRMSIDKLFHGPLEAVSRGQMLSAGNPASGSAAYVAVERVVGTLDGKAGSFALYHTGVMNRGASSLTILVVPDSGTGDLAGISGTVAIEVREKKHYYTMDYDIP